MAREGFDIGHELGFAQTRRRAADPAREGNDEATVTALIGADLEQFGRHDPIKASPVEAVVGVVDFAREGRHKRDRVALAFGQRGDSRRKFGVIEHDRPLARVHLGIIPRHGGDQARRRGAMRNLSQGYGLVSNRG